MKRVTSIFACVLGTAILASGVGAAPTEKGGPGPAPSTMSKVQATTPTFKESTWPLAFDLAPGERSGAGFSVGAPGAVVVTVTWEGPPLTIKVGGPGGTPVVAQGAKSPATINATATEADVKAGPIWGVSIAVAEAPRTAPEAPGAARRESRAAPPRAASAKGTISVTHPAGNDQAASDAFARAVAAKEVAVPKAAATPLAPPTAVTERVTALQNERMTHRAALVQQLSSKVPAKVMQTATAQFAMVEVPLATAQPAPAQPAPGQSQSAATGVSTVGGGGGIQTVAAPAITSLSVSEGEPGDPVLVSGSAFTSTQGEVHFIVANGKDLSAPITWWNDTQILAAVPTVTGVAAFPGYVYVQRGTTKSTLVSFRFKPTLEVRTLGMTADRSLAIAEAYRPGTGYVRYFEPFIFGMDGYDQFYLTTHLKNGWVVDSAYVGNGGFSPQIVTEGHGDAYIKEVRTGTDSPYIKVRWWIDGFSAISYKAYVVVKGPKGLAEQ